ncbi:MAG: cupin domain-containing protein [Steroidobacteraceae bacterium]|jgi:uncharacterized cupin superfamily protein|nr:cupin domain-containing protein [Steroidobacteraceae bacterium]
MGGAARDGTPVPALVVLGPGAAAESAPVDPARVLGGAPVTTVANAYSDAGARFHCGTWSSTPGAWRVSYTEHEFCHLLEGRVRLVADDGTAREFAAGDAWVIPAGFRGTWETLEPARKYYAIYEAVDG